MEAKMTKVNLKTKKENKIQRKGLQRSISLMKEMLESKGTITLYHKKRMIKNASYKKVQMLFKIIKGKISMMKSIMITSKLNKKFHQRKKKSPTKIRVKKVNVRNLHQRKNLIPLLNKLLSKMLKIKLKENQKEPKIL